MSEAELIFTALAELSTRQIAETTNATGTPDNKAAAKTGGNIAKKARLELEGRTRKKLVTGENFLPPPTARIQRITVKSEAKPTDAQELLDGQTFPDFQ